jgi:hypothetical protein
MLNSFPNLGEDMQNYWEEDKPLSRQASLMREHLMKKPTPQEFDEFIVSTRTDPYSYSSDKFFQKIITYREDIRSLAYNIFFTPAPDLAENFTSWVLSIQEPSENPKDLFLNFLKEDSLYLIAHGFNRKEDLYSHVSKNINDILSRGIILAQKQKQQYFLSSPAVLEASWLIACNPKSTEENFEIFGPNDPQWFTVLSHPNFPVEKMFAILNDFLNDQQKTVSDIGYVDAIFKNPKWNEHTIEGLYLESPDTIKSRIVPYLLEHPECPVFLLEKFFENLGVDGKVRFAQTTKNPDRLIQLSSENNPNILKAVAQNPYTPEHIAVKIVLEASS